MDTVKIRGVVIGEGAPKICATITQTDEAGILEQAAAADREPCELIEWRADYYDTGAAAKRAGRYDVDSYAEILEKIRTVTGKPVIFTMRTADEGGIAEMDRNDYCDFVRNAAEVSQADIIDVEAFGGDSGFEGEKMTFIVSYIYDQDKKVILSNHDFKRTPDPEEIVRRLCIMNSLDADISKVAFMPENDEDVLKLLEAARIMKDNYADKPFIAISMGEAGQASRVCGGSFGSAISYATIGAPSAPGQMSVSELSQYIREYDAGNDEK